MMATRIAIAHWSQRTFSEYAEFFRRRGDLDITVVDPGAFSLGELLERPQYRFDIDAVLVHRSVKGWEDLSPRENVEAIRRILQIKHVILVTDDLDGKDDLERVSGASLVVFEHQSMDYDVLADRIRALVSGEEARVPTADQVPGSVIPVVMPPPPSSVASSSAPVPPPYVRPSAQDDRAPAPAAPAVEPVRSERIAASAPSLAIGTQVLAVMGVAGGVGATTFAFHFSRVLAAASAVGGAKVCLLDARYPRSTLFQHLPFWKESSREQALREFSSLDRLAARWVESQRMPIINAIPVQWVAEEITPLYIIPSAASDQSMADLVRKTYAGFVSALVRQLKTRQFNYVVVLLGPDMFVPTHREVLAEADHCILVTTQHAPYYPILQERIRYLMVDHDPYYTERNLDVVLNRFVADIPLPSVMFEKDQTGVRLLGTIGEHRSLLARRVHSAMQFEELPEYESGELEGELEGIVRFFESNAGREGPGIGRRGGLLKRLFGVGG